MSYILTLRACSLPALPCLTIRSLGSKRATSLPPVLAPVVAAPVNKGKERAVDPVVEEGPVAWRSWRINGNREVFNEEIDIANAIAVFGFGLYSGSSDLAVRIAKSIAASPKYTAKEKAKRINNIKTQCKVGFEFYHPGAFDFGLVNIAKELAAYEKKKEEARRKVKAYKIAKGIALEPEDMTDKDKVSGKEDKKVLGPVVGEAKPNAGNKRSAGGATSQLKKKTKRVTTLSSRLAKKFPKIGVMPGPVQKARKEGDTSKPRRAAPGSK